MAISEARREYLREYQNRWLKKRRTDWLKEHGPCVECGSWEDLEIDHIDRTKKWTNHIWSYRQEKRDKELAKCQVLCYECHLKKTKTEIPQWTNGNRKLTEEQIMQVFKLHSLGKTQREIQDVVGIDHTNISKLLNGKTYKEITSIIKKILNENNYIQAISSGVEQSPF